MFHVKPCEGQKVCRPLHRVKQTPPTGMTRTDIVKGMGASLTLGAPKTDHVKCAGGGRNENAPRTFATAKWRRLAGARRRHKAPRRTGGSRNENAPRIFATAKWRPLADARGRHKTHRRTSSVPTPYQGRVQGAGTYTRMFRNTTNNQSIH